MLTVYKVVGSCMAVRFLKFPNHRSRSEPNTVSRVFNPSLECFGMVEQVATFCNGRLYRPAAFFVIVAPCRNINIST